MALKCPRAAHRLLTTCVTQSLNYLATTIPPQFTTHALQVFDTEIQTSFFKIINHGSPEFKCSELRLQRATVRATLPAPTGCGLFFTSDKAAIAWWASVQACLDEPLLFSLRNGLERFVDPSWHLLSDALDGTASHYWTAVAHLLPPKPQGLLDGSLFFRGASNTTKLNKAVLHQIV